MFKLIENPTFTHVVTAMVPVDGGHEKQTFKVTYQVCSSDEIDAFDLATTQGTTDFLNRVVTRFDDIVGADEQPLPYSNSLRDKVIALPWARTPIARGYFDAIRKSAEGN